MQRDCERLEENLNIFIKRMHEKYQEDKYTGLASDERKRRNSIDEDDDSDTSSLTDEDLEGFAE